MCPESFTESAMGQAGQGKNGQVSMQKCTVSIVALIPSLHLQSILAWLLLKSSDKTPRVLGFGTA